MDHHITRVVSTVTTNTQPGPKRAKTTPASVGPTARAALYAMLIAVMACAHSSRGTGSTTDEFHAGVSTAVQQPDTNTNNSTDAGPAHPVSTKPASRRQAAVWASSDAVIRRRRSVVSASTPAGSASKNMGKNTAVCTKAARKDEPVASTMNQAAAMVCMPLPIKNAPPHSHRPRKACWRSGLQIEEGLAIRPLSTGWRLRVSPAPDAPAAAAAAGPCPRGHLGALSHHL